MHINQPVNFKRTIFFIPLVHSEKTPTGQMGRILRTWLTLFQEYEECLSSLKNLENIDLANLPISDISNDTDF